MRSQPAAEDRVRRAWSASSSQGVEESSMYAAGNRFGHTVAGHRLASAKANLHYSWLVFYEQSDSFAAQPPLFRKVADTVVNFKCRIRGGLARRSRPIFHIQHTASPNRNVHGGVPHAPDAHLHAAVSPPRPHHELHEYRVCLQHRFQTAVDIASGNGDRQIQASEAHPGVASPPRASAPFVGQTARYA